MLNGTGELPAPGLVFVTLTPTLLGPELPDWPPN